MHTSDLRLPRAYQAPDLSAFVDPFAEPGLKDYLKAIYLQMGAIRFVGLTLGEVPDRRMEQLFVEPALGKEPCSPDREPPTEQDESEEGPWTAASVLQAVPRLVALGDPGSGKSTLVKWLASELARPRPGRVVKQLERLVPLPLVLRDLPLHKGIPTWEALLDLFLVGDFGKLLDEAGRESLKGCLERGQALVIVDGLDEVSGLEVRHRLRRVLLEGMDACLRCRWLITSRPVGYDEVPLDSVEDDFRLDNLSPEAAGDMHRAVASMVRGGLTGKKRRLAKAEVMDSLAKSELPVRRYVLPFRQAKVADFVRNWYLEHESGPDLAFRQAQGLLSVFKNPSLARLSRNPTLLTLMALIYRVQAHLPHGRAILYQQISEAYLERLARVGGLMHLDYGHRDTSRWLSRVAYRMQERRTPSEEDGVEPDGVLASRDEILGWVMEAGAPDLLTAQAFLDYCTRRSGLLQARSEEHFAFIHLSFQEFYAAWHLEREMRRRRRLSGSGATVDELRARFEDELWQEVMVFLFELLEEENAQDELLDIVGDAPEFPWLSHVDKESMGVSPAAQCFARLLVDSHIKLSPEVRRQGENWVWERHCEASRERWRLDPQPLALLAAQEGQDLDAFLAARLEGRSGLTSLNLRGLPLKCIPELEELTGLHMLDCSSTQVSDLSPLSNLTGLEVMYCHDTQVSDLSPLSNLTGLQTLDCSSTQVSDLSPLSDLTGLQTLGCSSTQVFDLSPLSNLTGLQALYCWQTQVSDLSPLSNLTGLLTLHCWQTQVSDLSPLSNLTRLRGLYSWSTQVSDLSPLSNLTRLHTLYCGFTQVSDLSPLSNLTGLQTLHCWSTQVSDLSPLLNLTRLQTLECRNTQVSDLSPLAGLRELKTLDVHGTRVKDLTPLAHLSKLEILHDLGSDK